jgi:DNA-binding transcriptional MocR family regulator
MSWQHARTALGVQGLKPHAKFVLVAVALRAGTDGRAWPSLARIAADTGYGRSTISAAIAELAETGHLQVIHTHGRANMMTMTHPDPGWVTRPDPGPTRPDPGRDPSRSWTQKSKRIDHEVATTGSSAERPAVADNGNGISPAAVIHNGPAPGESWGEYRERGGR